MLSTDVMRAISQCRYGSAEVLRFEEVPKPVPGDGEVPDAIRYLAAGHARGKLIVTI